MKSIMAYQDILRIKLQGPRTKTMLENKRRKRIKEAMSWESGTENSPLQHLITTLPSGIKVYFLKPGKEVFSKKRPNPYDMLPVVGTPDVKLNFEDVWSNISKVSVVNFDSFKAVLTLIYRNAFFIDHVEKDGLVRYCPHEEIVKAISDIEKEVGDSSFGLMNLLHFLDILGWNEDVKYHIENGKPTFSGKYDFNVGRINTLLTCIRVPYQASLFVKHVIDGIGEKKRINFRLLYTIMQQFAKSRGTCTPTQQQLVEWLSPYVTK